MLSADFEGVICKSESKIFQLCLFGVIWIYIVSYIAIVVVRNVVVLSVGRFDQMFSIFDTSHLAKEDF